MPGQSNRLRVRHKVWLDAAGRFALGDDGVELLGAIDATGSIWAAARKVGWSYRHTLAHLATAERGLGYPLVEPARGDHERGGALLPPNGKAFLRRYIAFRRRLDAALDRLARSVLTVPGHRAAAR